VVDGFQRDIAVELHADLRTGITENTPLRASLPNAGAGHGAGAFTFGWRRSSAAPVDPFAGQAHQERGERRCDANTAIGCLVAPPAAVG
jgi:hypothetical protein